MQDGIDLITPLASHPETARRLARKLWAYFVSETETPDPRSSIGSPRVYFRAARHASVMRAVLHCRRSS